MTTVRITNDYACGRHSESEEHVREPAQGEPLDEWWDGLVHPLTGDGHPCGAREHAIYVATVIGGPMDGASQTWEG